MNSAILDRTKFGLDWGAVFHRTRQFAAYVIVFAIGGWVTAIRDQSADLPYKDRQTIRQEQLQKVAGPNPLATVKCLTRKSAVATKVAKQAVKAATADDDTPVPNVGQIPNCPTPPAQAAAPK